MWNDERMPPDWVNWLVAAVFVAIPIWLGLTYL